MFISLLNLGVIFLKLSTKNLTLIAVIASLYVALTFIFAKISYGDVQFRVSEVLNVLTLFNAVPIYGVTLGCLISNLVGLFLGIEGSSIADLFIGTLATFIAACLCYYIGKSKNKVLIYGFGMLPVVLINGLFVGLELTFINRIGESFILNFLLVSFGELVVCYGLGSFLIYALLKNNLYKKLF